MPKRHTVSWGSVNRSKLQRAIDKYNSVMESWKERGFDEIPNKRNLQREMRSIRTPKELRDRIAELEEASSSTADIPVAFRGKIVPEYMVQLIESVEQEIDADHESRRSRLYPEWDEMTNLEQAVAKSKAPIMPTSKTSNTASDLEDLENQRLSEQLDTYIANYETEWTRYCTVSNKKNKVLDDIEYIVTMYEDAFQDILAIGYDYAQIEYIYEASAYADNPKTRHNRIVDFWSGMRKHLDGGGNVSEFTMILSDDFEE